VLWYQTSEIHLQPIFQQMIKNMFVNNMLDLTECHLAAHKILLKELSKFEFIDVCIVF